MTLPDGVTAAFASGPYRTLPALPALEPLLPGSGLAPGAITATAPGLPGAALMAAASAVGGWCGIAGMPHFGVAAEAGTGMGPNRLMLAAEPGPGAAQPPR